MGTTANYKKVGPSVEIMVNKKVSADRCIEAGTIVKEGSRHAATGKPDKVLR
jgi:hypothetical protein